MKGKKIRQPHDSIQGPEGGELAEKGVECYISIFLELKHSILEGASLRFRKFKTDKAQEFTTSKSQGVSKTYRTHRVPLKVI